MSGRGLSKEDIVTIHALKKRGVSNSEIARQLGVREGSVRYHARRKAEGATDGRKEKVSKAAAFEGVIREYEEAHRAVSRRPMNVRALHEHLRAHHGFGAGYKSLLRYVRRLFGAPPVRTWRRVETPRAPRPSRTGARARGWTWDEARSRCTRS